MYYCYKCGKEFNIRGAVGRERICPDCQSDIHCCFNCKFHNEDSSYKCEEPEAKLPSDSTKANYCEFFVLKYYHTPPKDLTEERRKARERLDAIFKKTK